MGQTTLWEARTQIQREIERVDNLTLSLDFDGTLVPIVSDPAEAVLPDDTRCLLAALARVPSIDVAIVSGRSLDDVRSRVGLPELTYAGNHGLEIDRNERRWTHPHVEHNRDMLSSIVEEIEEGIAPIQGAFIEDKYATASVHVREVADRQISSVHDVVEELVSTRDELRTESGKSVIQIRPAVEWDKGHAIRRITSEARTTLTIHVGDDLTDANGFRTIRTLPGPDLTVAVGNCSLPADYALSTPSAVSRWLQWLCETQISSISSDLSV